MKFLILASIVLLSTLVSAGGGGGKKKQCEKCDTSKVLGKGPFTLPVGLVDGLSTNALIDHARSEKGKCLEAIVTCPHSLGKPSELYNADGVALATSYTQLYRSVTCNDEGKWKAVDKSAADRDAVGLFCVIDPEEAAP